jgi:hypothetical protein
MCDSDVPASWRQRDNPASVIVPVVDGASARRVKSLWVPEHITLVSLFKVCCAPQPLVRLIYQVLESEGLLKKVSGDHTVWANSVSPELARLLRSRSV